jgi:hypothetical protein
VAGFLAVIGATAAFAAPVSLGAYPHAPNTPRGLHPVSDPVEGAWAWFPSPGGEQLRRIREDGRVTAVALPRELRGEDLGFTLFPDGWALATDRFWIARRTRYRCCASFVAAQRSPAGRWTPVQVVSRPGARVYASTAVDIAGQIQPQAVEVAGRVQLAWDEEFMPGVEPETPQFAPRVAVARLGHRFGSAQVLLPLFRQPPFTEAVLARNGHLFDTAILGDRRVERELSSSGRLGLARVLRSHIINGPGPEALSQPDGSELWVYEGENEQLFVARRAPRASRLEAPKRVTGPMEAGFQAAQSADGHVLLSTRTFNQTLAARDQSRITAADVSPSGELAPAQTAAFDPEVEHGFYEWAGAIDDWGDQLILTAVSGGGPPAASLWASVATATCRRYSARIALAPVAGPFGALTATAGRHNVFFVAWAQSQKVLLTLGRISCRHVRRLAH